MPGAKSSWSTQVLEKMHSNEGCIKLECASNLEAFLEEAANGTDGVASRLILLLDYDLTCSVPMASECHHMLRDATAVPAGFRQGVQTLFAAAGNPSHPEHDSIFHSPTDADRPHRFWMHYNRLLVEHRITQSMIDDAVAHEKENTSGRKLLRDGVGELLALCDEAAIPVVILSAGLEQVIRSAFAVDGVRLPASCHVLTNTLIFEEDAADGGCVAVEPTAPPASREGKLKLLGGLSQLSSRSLVLMVGDKPVDAKVARGLPPLAQPPLAGSVAADRGNGCTRAELSFGFFNQRRPEGNDVPARLSDWQSAFDLLAHDGNGCTFAPVVALVRCLLASGKGGGNPSASLLEEAASRAAAARRTPSLKDLNSLLAAEGLEPISESDYLAFRDWAEAKKAVMDDETYCDFRCEMEADEPMAMPGGPVSAVHQALDRQRRRC